MTADLIRYRFPGFSLLFDPEASLITTIYDDSRRPKRVVGLEDMDHPSHLGIGPQHYGLAYELSRHLIGYCVLGKSAGCGDREWNKSERAMVHSLIRHTLAPQEEPVPDDSLVAIAVVTDLDRLSTMLAWLLEAPLGADLDLRIAEW
jgi:hypothetical protein